MHKLVMIQLLSSRVSMTGHVVPKNSCTWEATPTVLNWSRFLNEQERTGSLESGCAFLYVRMVLLEGDTDRKDRTDKRTMPIVGDIYTTSVGLSWERGRARKEREFLDPLSHDEWSVRWLLSSAADGSAKIPPAMCYSLKACQNVPTVRDHEWPRNL